jgi:hypothetical protein
MKKTIEKNPYQSPSLARFPAALPRLINNDECDAPIIARSNRSLFYFMLHFFKNSF